MEETFPLDKIIQSKRRIHKRHSHRKIPSGTAKNLKKLWEDFAQDEGLVPIKRSLFINSDCFVHFVFQS